MRKLPRSISAQAVAAVVSLFLANAAPLISQHNGSPALPVPEPAGGWGEIQPVSIFGDTTHYIANHEPYCGDFYVPFWFDLAEANGLLFAATGTALEVWDISNPAGPEEVTTNCGPQTGQNLVLGPFRKSDTDFYLKSIATFPNTSDVLVGGFFAMGLVIYEYDPTSRQVYPIYQDEGSLDGARGEILSISDVVASRLSNGLELAFGVSSQGNLFGYSVSAARNLSTTCYEHTQEPTIECPGVYLGLLQANIDGFIAGTGDFLAVSRGSNGAAVYRYGNNLLNPALMGSVAGRARGLAMWEHAGGTYVAVAFGSYVEVHDVNCLSGGCAGGSLRATLQTPPSPGVPFINRLQASVDGGTVYLFAGTTVPVGSEQKEYLFDVTDLSTAPPQIPGDPAAAKEYWEWYYQFRNAAPISALVVDGLYVRSNWSFVETHRLNGNFPPSPDFDLPPAPTYDSDTVQFTDRSSRNPTDWLWNFGALGQSTAQNPTLTLPGNLGPPYPATLSVRLDVCNSAMSCDFVIKDLTILDPVPEITSVTANALSAPQCGTVSFEAVATGKPALTYDWSIGNATGTGTTFDWIIPADQPAGSYSPVLSVENAFGTDSAPSASVTVPNVDVTALPTLANPSASFDPPDLGLVQFYVDAQGATEWEWDFGDGSPPLVTVDPAIGPNPTHTYADEGIYQVTVTVRNCRDGERTTSINRVVIDEVLRLEVLSFRANLGSCSTFLGFCEANTNQPIPFSVVVSGDPTLIEIDWGTGRGFEEVTPANGVVNHAYATPGEYQPTLMITRGSQVSGQDAELPVRIQGTGQPPSISISGPTSVSVGATAQYSATASNCGPQPTTWAWSVQSGSGTLLGTDEATITVSWTASGVLTASPVDHPCDHLTGSRSVTVGSAPPPPPPPSTTNGGLNAQFSTSGSMVTGSSVSFNASSSAGSPTTYYWDFGDNVTAGPNGAVKQTSHVYTAPGTYTVKLEIAKSDSNCANGGICVDSTTKTVQITAGGPPKAVLRVDPECADPCEILVGESLKFVDMSTGAVQSRQWRFGDGTQSTGSEVTHQWSRAGAFEVILKVSGGSTTSEVRKTVLVKPVDPDGTCFPSETVLCTQNYRFAVDVVWATLDNAGDAQVAEAATDDSGLFWFFNEDNWELLVKTINGCALNSYYWVFAGSTTDVAYTLTVTDTLTGNVAQYANQMGVSAPAITDSGALPCAVEGAGTAVIGITDHQAGGLVASFTASPSAPAAGQAVTFDASSSLGTPTSYYWRFGDGTNSGVLTSSTVTHSYSQPGSYTVSLEVGKSGAGCFGGICTAAANNTLVVGGEVGPLEARIGVLPECAESGCETDNVSSLRFLDQSSGAVTTRTWDFGDGTTSSNAVVDHSWLTPGAYEVKLTVSDGVGTSEATVSVVVAEAMGGEPGGQPGDEEPQGACQSSSTELCLNAGRFRVDITWQTESDSGEGRAVPFRTSDSGLFWFFDAANWEILVKVINGCALNDHYWVFAGSTTNVAYELTVTDTLTGESKTYSNEFGVSAPAITDSAALAVCQ